MLKLPGFADFRWNNLNVSIYQDDTLWWKFYLISNEVMIRRDEKGNPSFLLVKYAFGDQDREANKNLPRGGGYVAFDVEMAVPEECRKQILPMLQKYVNDTWNRMKELADSAGHDVRGYRLRSTHGAHSVMMGVNDLNLGIDPDAPEAPPGDKPPLVILDSPTWTQGKFRVSAPQSKELVSNRVTEGPISLLGSNVASANMDLTPGGATFMEKTLLNPEGTGATDMTPIQVTYELKFWARLPPVRLRISADTRTLYMALKEIDHNYDSHSCSEDEMQHYETQMQMAIQKGLIQVQLDTGTLSFKDDFIQQLHDMAVKFVQDLIKDKFYEKKEAPPPPDDGTKDFLSADRDIYYLKTELDFTSVSINYNEEMTAIVEWPCNPQGTMQTFFSGLSKEEMKKYVRVVDLDDDFFKTLQLSVAAFADWEREPIAFVEAQVRYTGRDENNNDVEKVQTFTLTKDHTTDFWDPSLIGKKRQYSYRYRTCMQGRAPDEFTRWENDTTPKLNFSIANPGKLAVDVLAGSIDFKQTVNQVQLELSYGDSAAHITEEAATLVFTDGVQSKSYQRYIYAPWSRPLRYRSRFFLKGGQVIESEWKETRSRQLLINEPFVDKLDVQLVPAGDWDGVVQTVVNLRYDDTGNDYHVDGAYSLKSLEEFKTWWVVLRNAQWRRFQFKVATTWKDGSSAQGEWIDAESDQSVLIRVKQTPRLRVSMLPALVDFKLTPIVECTLRYDDAANDVHKVQTFPFSKPEEAVWIVPLSSEQRPRSYKYQITYHTADGQNIVAPQQSSDATALIVPKLVVPEVACTVFAKLVDFVATPLVSVDIDYKDQERNIAETETLVFTDAAAQGFRFQVRPESPREYTVTVTYYLSDGKVVTRPPVKLDKDKIVIPRYVAAV